MKPFFLLRARYGFQSYSAVSEECHEKLPSRYFCNVLSDIFMACLQAQIIVEDTLVPASGVGEELDHICALL